MFDPTVRGKPRRIIVRIDLFSTSIRCFSSRDFRLAYDKMDCKMTEDQPSYSLIAHLVFWRYREESLNRSFMDLMQLLARNI